MALYQKKNGFIVLTNADTIETPKAEMIKEHEALTGLLDRTAEELEAECDKQKKELEEYKANGKIEDWIKAELSNDETSTDEQLAQHLIKEGGVDEATAKQWVAKRGEYLKKLNTGIDMGNEWRKMDVNIKIDLCREANVPIQDAEIEWGEIPIREQAKIIGVW